MGFHEECYTRLIHRKFPIRGVRCTFPKCGKIFSSVYLTERHVNQAHRAFINFHLKFYPADQIEVVISCDTCKVLMTGCLDIAHKHFQRHSRLLFKENPKIKRGYASKLSHVRFGEWTVKEHYEVYKTVSRRALQIDIAPVELDPFCDSVNEFFNL